MGLRVKGLGSRVLSGSAVEFPGLADYDKSSFKRLLEGIPYALLLGQKENGVRTLWHVL